MRFKAGIRWLFTTAHTQGCIFPAGKRKGGGKSGVQYSSSKAAGSEAKKRYFKAHLSEVDKQVAIETLKRGFSYRTEQNYTMWFQRLLKFLGIADPSAITDDDLAGC